MLQLNSSCIIDPETGLNVCLYVMARQMLLFTFAYLPGWSKSPWTGHTSPLTQVLSTPTSNRSPVENQGSISKSPNAKIFTSKCQNIYGVLLFNFIKALMPSNIMPKIDGVFKHQHIFFGIFTLIKNAALKLLWN